MKFVGPQITYEAHVLWRLTERGPQDILRAVSRGVYLTDAQAYEVVVLEEVFHRVEGL